MKTTLSWKKGIFNNTYEIVSGNIPVGSLKDKALTQSADGNLYGKQYTFKTKGFFKQETQIIETRNGSVIGKITYYSWMTKARIEYVDKVVMWKYNNVWNTDWSVFDSEGPRIHYHGSSTKGNIKFDNQDELLILTGLFIANYYWQMSIVIIIAVLIPIWAAVLH